MSGPAGRGGVDVGLAVTSAAWAVQRAVRAAAAAGAEVPGWAETAVGLLDAWAGQLEGQGGSRAGLAGAGRASGAWWRAPGGVLEGDRVPAARWCRPRGRGRGGVVTSSPAGAVDLGGVRRGERRSRAAGRGGG